MKLLPNDAELLPFAVPAVLFTIAMFWVGFFDRSEKPTITQSQFLMTVGAMFFWGALMGRAGARRQ